LLWQPARAPPIALSFRDLLVPALSLSLIDWRFTGARVAHVMQAIKACDEVEFCFPDSPWRYQHDSMFVHHCHWLEPVPVRFILYEYRKMCRANFTRSHCPWSDNCITPSGLTTTFWHHLS
jgi:hypothetical protein